MKLCATRLIGVALLGLLLVTACGDDDPAATTAPTEETGLTTEEAATASSIAGAFNAVSQIGNLVIGTVRSLRPSLEPFGNHNPEPAGFPAPGTCPSVGVDSIEPHAVSFSIDFANGCTMNSGLQASGSIVVNWRGSSTADTVSASFRSFSAEGYQIDGALTATGSGTTWTLAFDGTMTSGGKAWTVDAVLGFVLDNRGTLTNPDDDLTTVTGGGTFTVDAKTYQVAITQALVFQTDCSYPVTGALTYQEQSDNPLVALLYTIDFGVGDCCTASVSVANRSEDMNLCVAP